MNRSTVVEFNYDGELWPIVEKWAGENGYKLKESTDSERVYQKGTGFLVAPMMLKITSNDGATIVESWIRVGPVVRLMALYLVPSEMGVESGGFKLVVPRKIAREGVNKLLKALEQELIS